MVCISSGYPAEWETETSPRVHDQDFTDQMRSCLAGHRVSYFLPFTELSYLGAIQCRGAQGIAKPAEARRATSLGLQAGEECENPR